MNQAIQDFVDGKRIAVVGASRDQKKFGNTAYKELRSLGYEVYAVNPSTQQIEGDPCYPNLTSLKGKLDGALVCLPADQGGNILREAAQVGLRNVWLQQGAESPELLTLARELNLNLVSGKCILMYATPVRGFHGWHRLFNKLFGKL